MKRGILAGVAGVIALVALARLAEWGFEKLIRSFEEEEERVWNG